MIRLPPRSSRTYTLFPYPTLFRSYLASAVVGISGTTSVEKFYIPIAAAIRFPEKIRIIQCLHISPMRWHIYCCLLLVWSARFVRVGSGKPGPFFYLTLFHTLRGKRPRCPSSSPTTPVTRTRPSEERG